MIFSKDFKKDKKSKEKTEVKSSNLLKLKSKSFVANPIGSLNTARTAVDQTTSPDESRKHTIVCTHWLRNLCKKGENCEYLHSYDPSKMPICKYFQIGSCKNEYCHYLHIDAKINQSKCPYYESGFCKNGAYCKNSHKEKELCTDYIYGFCIRGPSCNKMHLKTLISIDDDNLETLANYGLQFTEGIEDINLISVNNKAISKEELQEILVNDEEYMRKAKDVICYRCKRIGHYPVICEIITKIELGLYKQNHQNEENKRNIYSKQNSFSSGSLMIDGMAVPKFTGNNLGSAMETIYSWDQIFNSILTFYQDKKISHNVSDFNK